MNIYEGSPEKIAAKVLGAMNATDGGVIVIRWRTENGDKVATLDSSHFSSDAQEAES